MGCAAAPGARASVSVAPASTTPLREASAVELAMTSSVARGEPPPAWRDRAERAPDAPPNRLGVEHPVVGPSVTISRVAIEGPLDRVELVVAGLRTKFVRCARSAAASGVAIERDVRLVLHVLPSGDMRDAAVESADADALSSCLRGVASHARFDESQAPHVIRFSVRITM
jgi:hypothetical protein